jgi:hypothetical protein
MEGRGKPHTGKHKEITNDWEYDTSSMLTSFPVWEHLIFVAQSVQWLSRGKVLKQIYDSRKIVQLFMDIKGKPVPEIFDEDWILDFAFLVDMTQLQGKSQLVIDIFPHVKAFEVKLSLWEIQLTKQNSGKFN